MKESALYELIAQYMNLKHPNTIYHFDLSGVYNPSHKTRNLYGRLNKRAWPDLFIGVMSPYYSNQGSVEVYSGLLIELKIKSPYLKDGVTLRKDEHIAEQAMVLKALESEGYKAVFSTGFEQTIQIIDDYLKE